MGLSSPKVEGGMTYDQRRQLLEDEDRMAQEREASQRSILEEQERQREAREEAQRQLFEQEEEDRLGEIERLEEAGAETVMDLAEAQYADEDTGASDMWSSLFMGTGFIPDGEDEEEYPD